MISEKMLLAGLVHQSCLAPWAHLFLFVRVLGVCLNSGDFLLVPWREPWGSALSLLRKPCPLVEVGRVEVVPIALA